MNPRPIVAVVFIALVGGGIAYWAWTSGVNTATPRPEANSPTARIPVPAASHASSPAPAVLPKRIELPTLPAVPAETDTPQRTQSPSSEEAARRASAAKAPDELDPNVTDFGEVQFTNGVPMQLTLNSGVVATITPSLRDDGSLQLRMETKEEAGNGAVRTSASTVVVQPGQGFAMTVGSSDGIKMTPKM